MTEVWREFIPNYEVSNSGTIRRSTEGRRTYAGRVMKAQKMTTGYLSVKPTIDGKNVQMYVHDIVAGAFLGEKPAGMSVNHIDGDKKNNNASNLEYVTHAENMRHAADAGLMVCGTKHPASKLNDEYVRSLRADRRRGMSFSGIAKKYEISLATAFNIANCTYWKHIT